MKAIFHSIRTKLTFWYTLLVLSTLVAFGITSFYYTRDRLEANLDISLSNEVRWIQNFLQPRSKNLKPSKRSIDALLGRNQQNAASDTTAEQDDAADEIWNQIFEHTLLSPKKTYIQVQDRQRRILYRSYSLGGDTLSIADSLGMGEPAKATIDVHGELVRVAVLRDKKFDILVGYPLAELREALDNLFSIFRVLIPIAALISIIGGLYLASTSLRHVDDITKRARKITAENLDQTIPERKVNDEIGRLISTINDMIRRLHDSFAQIKQFSADASHELRTPLTVMRGEIELALRTTKSPQEYRQVLASTLEELLRMSTIIDNLLTLAKADQGLYEAELSEVQLDSLVQELHEDGEILAESKSIHVHVEKTEPIVLVGDLGKLRQLFLNLISNAIRYTPEGGSVSIAIERQNGTALFRVRDTGIGIPPDEIDMIFHRFYRVDKARSRELGGSGLGLSIAKWIAELHRGKITVESEVEKGSTFTVHLPIN